MSHFSGSHLVTKFDSKLSRPLTGQRLAKITYKSRGNNPAKYPSVCVSIPPINSDSEEFNQLIETGALDSHIREMLASAQDGIIRALYESSDGELSQVSDTDISLSECVKYLDSVAAGGRLTTEAIETWFDAAMTETVETLIIEKLKYPDILTEDQSVTVKRHVNGYRGLFASLAGGKTILQENQIKSLLRVAELAENDEMADRLIARLKAMSEKPKLADLLEL